MWGSYNKIINKNKLLYYCIVCIDILWIHLLHIRITKMVLYSIYQTHMLQNTQGSKEWGKYPLTAHAGPEFVMFCHILSLNLPYKDESVFNISSLNSANIHFCYWNTGLHSDALEDSFLIDSYWFYSLTYISWSHYNSHSGSIQLSTPFATPAKKPTIYLAYNQWQNQKGSVDWISIIMLQKKIILFWQKNYLRA